MKYLEYLMIDTWNGEGYSDSKITLQAFKDKTEAQRGGHKMATEFAGEMGLVKTILNPKEGYAFEYVTHEEDEEDSGAVQMIEFTDDIIGAIAMPNVNHYEIIRTQERWDEVVQYIKDFSEDYAEENELYGTVHHGMEEDYDWILFERADFKIAVDKENLEFWDGGDGIEYEIWKDTTTGKFYTIPIEIVRDFNDLEDKEK